MDRSAQRIGANTPPNARSVVALDRKGRDDGTPRFSSRIYRYALDIFAYTWQYLNKNECVNRWRRASVRVREEKVETLTTTDTENKANLVIKSLGAVVEEAITDSTPNINDSGDNHTGGAPRSLLVRASLGTEDRKGDVIDSSGWELTGYRQNPVFLWAHDRSRPPIGVAREVWVSGKSLNALVEFAPTQFALEIAELYTKGFMRAVSVGFLPIETEIRKASDGQRGNLYRRQELLEISAVPVPMHSEALALERSEADESEYLDTSAADMLQLRAGVRRLVAAAGLLVD